MNNYEIFEKCYNDNSFEILNDYLADDCVYRSQWVFDEMQGREEIVDYLTAKAETIAKHNAFPKAKIVNIIRPFPQQAIAVSQGSDEIKVIIILSEENGKIKSIDLCMPELYEFK